MSHRDTDVDVAATTRRADRQPYRELRGCVLAVALASWPLETAEALQIEITGRAAVDIPLSVLKREAASIHVLPELLALKAEALREAKRDAVTGAIGRVLGPRNCQAPHVASQIDGLVSQLRQEHVIRQTSERVEKRYEASVLLAIDDGEFRTWLSDRGVPLPPARAYGILMVMDEFLGTGGDAKGRPSKTSQAYNAFAGQFQRYDLRIIDNSVFRSKYFKSTPLTVEQMQGSEWLSKYVAYAKAEAKADFLMVGTSTIVDEGTNRHTGDEQCAGTVTLKTFSTVDGESIASETFSESAAGSSSSDCAAMAAKRLAAIGGPVIGARIHDYWKRRCAHGREYVVTLRGDILRQSVRSAFTKALKETPGVERHYQRTSEPTQLQYVVTYKGTDPLDQVLAMALSNTPAFSKLDSWADGNQIQFCIGPCDAFRGN